MSAARAVLLRLLRRAESARRRGADERVAFHLGGASEYTALRALSELEAFHAEIALAERSGAIAATRETRSGDGARLLRLRVVDAAALARHLGVSLLDERVQDAERVLAPWRERFPVLGEVLAAWRAKRKPCGGPEAACDLVDAARVVAARLDDAGAERILRRESARLLGDSKRLEKLARMLEILATGELAASGLMDVEIWAMLGLRREPQPLLIAGEGSVQVAGVSLPLLRPYIGLPLEAVESIATTARCLVSIENLASFHEATRAPGAQHALLLYTGGMPSPVWRATYARLLAGLTPDAAVYHWGDIDEGGYRIAATLAANAREAGRHLLPWRMSPDDLPAGMANAVAVSGAVLAAMRRWAERAGWPQVSAALARHPLKLEQEQLDPVLPDDGA